LDELKMKALRTAILGCGKIARRHAEVLTSLEQVNLVGFCDQVVENAQSFNKTFGPGKVFTDHEQMFRDLDLDLLYICLPPYAHTNEVELACRQGVHFLIEKPIALTMDLAYQMAEYVHAGGVKCQVGFMYRHGEAVKRLKETMQTLPARGAELPGANLPGAGLMSARYSCNSLHRDWWRDRSKSGGQLVEQVIHLLDMARFFLGEPCQVYSVQRNLFHHEIEDYTGEDTSATIIHFDSGGIAVIAATNGAIPNRWDYDWRIVLPTITADFTDANHAIFHDTRHDWPSTLTVASEKNLFLAQTLDLLAAIREDRPPAVSIDEGVRSLNLALSAVLSAQQDQPIRIELPGKSN
jgi:predicted dehydrogenase